MLIQTVLLTVSLLRAAGSAPSVESQPCATVHPRTPRGASPRLDPNFIGFAFEESSFYLYATNEDGSPNKFTLALMHDLLGRSGGTPTLRVGGTSGDKGHYNASQQEPAVPDGRFNPPLWHEPWLSIGSKFFSAYRSLPGCQFIVMLPIFQDNISNTLEFAQQAFANVPPGALQAIEIGNEPDLNAGFTTVSWVKEFLFHQQQLFARFPWIKGKHLFQGLVYGTDNGTASRHISKALDAGVNRTGEIKQVSYHYYESVNRVLHNISDLQLHIVNHTRIKNHLANFTHDIKYLRKIAPGTPFVLGENGNSIPLNRVIGPDQKFSNVLGTALWNVDWQLQAMAVGVTRVNMQQIFYPGYAMWQPQGNGLLPPGVNANFYSQPLIGDFIGPSHATEMVELRFKKLNQPELLSGYAAYDHGSLARVALVNMRLWDPLESGSNRPSTNVRLKVVAACCFTAHWLDAPEGAYANTTITYSGKQWEYPSGQPRQAKWDTETFCVKDGELVIPLKATSAVLLSRSQDIGKYAS